ncbi:hypothetical protein [Azohydromonas aeria]|uniref:hypothetical protein n=1 Tax=Azohydromonas aeria TaxID=2590212 RepID=UPI0012FC868E|nr:hypothetical protein [Azohydromonas aeria]
MERGAWSVERGAWSVEREEAFARAQASVAQDGYVIASADNANGVISTTQGVAGSTARVPYNIVVAEEGAGSRVSLALAFGTTGGMVLNQQDVLMQFCKTLSAVGR